MGSTLAFENELYMLDIQVYRAKIYGSEVCASVKSCIVLAPTYEVCLQKQLTISK